MIIWFSLLIPIITLIVLFILFRDRIAWWEPALLIIGSFILICILKLLVGQIGIRDTEYLSNKVSQIEHHEKYVREWEEYVPEQGYTDDKGNYHVTVPAHWETRTEYHPEYWCKISNGNEYNVPAAEYNRIKKYWGGEIFTDLKHRDQRHGFLCPKGINCNCSDGRGDMFSCKWPRSFDTIEGVVWTHSYKNKIQVSKSVFNFPEVEGKIKQGLFEYPKINSNQIVQNILGECPNRIEANKILERWNAVIGPRPGINKDYKKAGRIWFLIFNNQPIQRAIDQQNYWKNGNKNEFIVCIGLDKSYNVQWSYVISWTKNEHLKSTVQNYINNQINTEFDSLKIANYVGSQCQKQFERREFAEFDYLTVEPPTWSIILCYIIVSLASIGISVFIVVNEDNKTTSSLVFRRR